MHIDFGYGYYDGGVDENQHPHGKGIITYYKPNTKIVDGSIEANFNHGVIVGDTLVDYKDGTKYLGGYDMNSGHRIGRGTLYYANGDRYEGEWKENAKHGKGTMYFSNGAKYIGDWFKNSMEGKCVFYYKNGNVYEGEVHNDNFTGKGKLKQTNGNIYEGDFLNDAPHGKGVFNFADGSKYVGGFKKGIFDGFGTAFDKTGKIIYQGNWKEGKFIG